MELIESIESINHQLLREFGKAFNGQPNFRVVFSDDQFEKRWTKYTDDGFELLVPEVRELPKYRQYIKAKYLLERLIPVVGETDLVDKISYECCWVFCDDKEQYLPPRFDAAKFVIEAMLSRLGKKGYDKYKDPNASEDARLESINKMEEKLFGNETSTGDSLAYKEAIVVPENLSVKKTTENGETIQ